MRHINNPTSGEVIIVDKVTDNGIYYSLFENAIHSTRNEYFISKNVATYDKSYIPTELMSINESITEAAQIKILETETNFVLSDDRKNWVIENGSTAEPTTLRILIPNEVVAREIALNSDFGNLLIAMRALSEWAVIYPHCLVQYLEELLESQKSLIESYTSSGIIIDYKDDLTGW